MSAKKILYFDKVPAEFKTVLFEAVTEGFDLWLWEEMDELERDEKLPLADYLVVATKKINEDIIAKAKKAKFIQKTGIGVDNIDLKAAEKYHLPVANTPGANAKGVAELTILLILALYRKLPLANDATKNGKWISWELRPFSYEMEGKTHGFIGFGNIGQETAKHSKVFGTNIIYYDQIRLSAEKEKALEATFMSLETVLEHADILSIHVPLLPETKGLIGIEEFQKMKKNAILINVSRGGVVKEMDLYDALSNGIIAGAGIDVWEIEPIDPKNPLLTLENVIATPHIGAGTRDTLQRVLSIAFQNIVNVDQGIDPDYVVNNVFKAKV